MPSINLVSLDLDGKMKSGTIVPYPAEYTHQCTDEVMENAGRAQFINGAWIIHDLLQITGPATALIDEALTYTVTLPAGSPDNTVNVRIASDGQQTDLGSYPVTAGQALIPLSFDTAGTYTITASSRFHGSDSVTLVVS